MTPDLKFQNIRAEGGDQREGFEEFSCQIFRRYPVPSGSRYERFRGAGGDGGVEAVWHLPSGNVVGFQSKYFLPLKTAHKAQLEKSLDTALDNHPQLSTYIISLPFDPTPTVKARSGEGEAEKLETWRKGLVDRAKARGAKVDVIWWMASELKSRTLALDGAAGRIHYWFGAGLLDAATLKRSADLAEDIAGKRYSPKLTVEMDAQATLRAFSRDDAWLASVKAQQGRRIDKLVDDWSSRPPKAGDADYISVQTELARIKAGFDALQDPAFSDADRGVMEAALVAAQASAGRLTDLLKAGFDAEHGAESDNEGWRQFQMEYMVAFPAADLDLSRKAVTILRETAEFVGGDPMRAAAQQTLLMRGPAGVGKTHTIIDFTKDKVAAGRTAIAILGQEIATAETPWRILAVRLGLPADSSKDTIVGLLSARAESDQAPALVLIDAVNETPDRARWQAWLPDMIASFKGRPVRLLLSCRDIYVIEAFDAGASTLPTFVHDGFAGREFEAAYAFAAFYKVGPPAEVIAQSEFANPLFLHLVCRAAQARGWTSITGGQINLTALIAAIFDGANSEAARRLDYDVRTINPVKDGARALAGEMARRNIRHLPLADASSLLAGVYKADGASRSLLHALEAADLVAVTEEGGAYLLRFAFERLGDILIAQSMVSGSDRATLEARFLTGDLAAFVCDEAAIRDNAGLLQALSIILPDEVELELARVVIDAPLQRQLARLALDVIAWRDIGSFNDTEWFERYMNRPVELAEIFGQMLVVAATPSHPLNIDRVGLYLWRQPMVDRDAYWNFPVTESWQARGAAHRLVRIALEQDLKPLSERAARKLGATLAWFCASSDREIRALAIEGLTRLFAQLDVAAPMFDQFATVDDDYIIEALLSAIYGAGLRRRTAEYWRVPAAVVYRHVFDSGLVTDNVLIRDDARLIIEEAVRAKVATPTITLSKVQPPYTSTWPLQFRYADWDALSKAHPKFPGNMLFAKTSMIQDFARYSIKPRVQNFDFVSQGLNVDQLYQWVFEHTLDLGYPGSSGSALSYDQMLVAKYGPGRGRTSATERLGKKYSRIALARLVGRLNDNVPRRVTTSPAPPAAALQGIDLRGMDPTRLTRASADAPQVQLASLFPALTPKDFDVEPKAWVPITGQTVRLSTTEDNPWVVLAADWTFHLDDDVKGRSRSRHCHIRSEIVPTADLAALRKALKALPPSIELPEFRRLFLGEYPSSAALKTPGSGLGPVAKYGNDTVVVVSALEDEWRDTDHVWCPSPTLIEGLALTWDGDRAWLGADERLEAVHLKQGRTEAVLIRQSALENALSQASADLVWSIDEGANATVDHNMVAYEDRASAWERKSGRIALICEHFQRYEASEDDSDAEADAEDSET